MSLNNAKITSFLKPTNTIPSPNYKINTSKLYNIENINRKDLFRSDYILPLKRAETSYTNNNSQNFIGNKLNRNIDSNKAKKILIPNENRYHKTLLQTSLEKIRNEIRQKRIENTKRMNELNERAINLNENYRNKNNISQYIGDFKDKTENCYKDNTNNIISLKEEETNKKNKKFDKDEIYLDLNESFSINSNKRKKVDNQNNFITQRQDEFCYSYNDNKLNNNNNSNIKTNNDKNNDNSKVIFGAPKKEINTKPLSNNFTFGLNPIKKNNNQKSLFNNTNPKEKANETKSTSLFGEKAENKKENLEKNEKKENNILFKAPKEYKPTTPLSSNISFGIKPKEEEKKDENKKEEQKVIFGCPKTEIISEPLSSKVNFGFVEKKEDN